MADCVTNYWVPPVETVASVAGCDLAVGGANDCGGEYYEVDFDIADAVEVDVVVVGLGYVE